MKKQLLITLILLSSSFVKSQVGINTDKPNSTLEIKSSPNNQSLVDGIIIPKLTATELENKNNLYTEKQHTSLIYITEGNGKANSKTENIKGSGFYFYDQKDSSITGKWRNIYKNIYNADGTITDKIRTVEIGDNTLNYTATGVNAFSVDGSTFSIDAGNNRVGIGTNKPERSLEIATSTSRFGWQHTDGTIKLNSFVGLGNGNATGGWIGTSTNHNIILYNNNSAKLNIDVNSSALFGSNAPSLRSAYTTFEIESRRDAKSADGILIPKTNPTALNDQNDMYNESQDGTLVYITRGNGTSGTKTQNIKGKGFYYYDHDLRIWVKLSTITATNARTQTINDNLKNINSNSYTIKSDDEFITTSANNSVNIIFENNQNIEIGKKVLLFNKNTDSKKILLTGVMGNSEIENLKGTTIIWDGKNWLNIGS